MPNVFIWYSKKLYKYMVLFINIINILIFLQSIFIDKQSLTIL